MKEELKATGDKPKDIKDNNYNLKNIYLWAISY